MSAAPLNLQATEMRVFLEHCQRLSFRAKSTIIHADNTSKHLYLLLKGTVSILINGEEEKDMIISFLNEGEFFGELSLFFPHQEAIAWVQANTECDVARIEYSRFQTLTKEYPDILLTLCAQIAGRLRDTTLAMRKLGYMGITEHANELLNDLCKQHPLEPPPTGTPMEQIKARIDRFAAHSKKITAWALRALRGGKA